MSPGPTLQIASPRSAADEPFGLWGRAFRPFFLGLGVYGALAVPLWTLTWLGYLPAPHWLVPMWWHGHEMVFGFVAAAIAGFLLTASPVWSGGPALAGRPLAALVVLWAAARVAFAASAFVPAWLVAVLDLAFLPAVAAAVVRTLWGSGQKRNYAVVGVVAVLAAANGFMHAEALGLAAGVAGRALRFSVDIVIVLILVIAGRITPAFTANALPRDAATGRDAATVEVRRVPWLGALAIGAAAALAVSTALVGRSQWTGALAVVAGLAALARMAGWQSWRVRSDPLLWSLHAGSGWVAVGLLLAGAADLGLGVPAASGLHALTAGAMGTTILAVVTRVGLGHTGRALVLPAGIVACYAAVHGAAVARVAAPFFAGQTHQGLLLASGFAWAAAFGLFAMRYAPILTTPRPDGRPG